MTDISIDISRRLGKFQIPDLMLREFPETVQLALSGMIVIRAEQRWDFHGIEYIAMSEHFDEISEGYQVPDYIAVIETIKNDDDETIGQLIKGWHLLSPVFQSAGDSASPNADPERDGK